MISNRKFARFDRNVSEPATCRRSFFFTVTERRWVVGWSRLPISRTTSTVRSNFRDTYNWFPAAVEVEGDKVTGKDYMGGGPRFPVTRALHESVKSWDVGKFRKLFSVAFE